MSLLSTLLTAMSKDDSLEAVAKKTGVSKLAIGGLLAIAVPMLIKKMTSNAQSQHGATSLLGALTQHTDTASVTDQLANADTADGSAIIGHILGSDQASTLSQLAAQSDLSEEQVSSVLDTIAPALMSSLSAANTENLQAAQAPAAGGLSSILGGILGGGSSSGSGNLLSSLFGGGAKEDDDISGANLLNLLMKSAK